eukprot:TRINITY_DN21639_c0_g1_i1.p2 TRINITY_DN21639_c0_g1~~TRINITY_DN21639_c0_g1_i1.p2  ORF type:complete len:110 (+),score=0.41 TRINITY_DN21639_c0_g1_i1:1-330(+)
MQSSINHWTCALQKRSEVQSRRLAADGADKWWHGSPALVASAPPCSPASVYLHASETKRTRTAAPPPRPRQRINSSSTEAVTNVLRLSYMGAASPPPSWRAPVLSRKLT